MNNLEDQFYETLRVMVNEMRDWLQAEPPEAMRFQLARWVVILDELRIDRLPELVDDAYQRGMNESFNA